MPIEFRKEEGRLVWVRSPFTGTVTYFTDVHRKLSGFRRRLTEAASQSPKAILFRIRNSPGSCLLRLFASRWSKRS